jgi:hypothetical protein
MTIKFKCANSDCGRQLGAPDEAEGKKARCPHCRQVMVVPVLALELTDEFAGVGDVSLPQPAPKADIAAILADGKTAACEKCRTPFPQIAMFCPFCGQKNPLWRDPAKRPVPKTAAEVSSETLATGCFKAPLYAIRNAKNILYLMAYAAALIMLANLLLIVAVPVMIFAPAAAMSVAVAIIMGGYFLSYYLNVIESSYEHLDSAPNIPEFQIKELLKVGLHAWAIMAVYVVPIVTLPLLPLGLLALAHTSDGRAYDFRWAIRQARGHVRQLGLLWGCMLLWLAVSLGAALAIWPAFSYGLAAAGKMGLTSVYYLLGLTLVAAGVYASLGGMALCVLFRCVGAFGRCHPSIADSLPESISNLAAYGWLFVGVVSSLASMQWVIGPALAAIARMLGASAGPSIS